MLSTPKSSGYPPRTHLCQAPWATPERLDFFQILTFPSLLAGVFSPFLSQVTLWSGNLQGEIQDQDANNKIPVF